MWVGEGDYTDCLLMEYSFFFFFGKGTNGVELVDNWVKEKLFNYVMHNLYEVMNTKQCIWKWL